MQSENEHDRHHEAASPGVSPAWQTGAIMAIFVIFILSGLTVILGVAYLGEHRKVLDGQGVTLNPSIPPNVVWSYAPAVAPYPGPELEPEPIDPPFPTVADLRPTGLNGLAGEPAKPPAVPAAIDPLARLWEDTWTAQTGVIPVHLTVAPDGQSMAFQANQSLFVGMTRGTPLEIFEDGGIGGPGPGLAAPGVYPGFSEPALAITSRPSWSADSHSVFFTDGQGRLRRHDLITNMVEKLPFSGDSPVSAGENTLIFRRSKATVKVESRGMPTARDPAEIVLANLATREVQVLLTEKTELWEPRTVSPDGRWLILSVEPRAKSKTPPLRQFHILDLKAGKTALPRPIGPAGRDLDAVFWVQEGKGLVLGLRPEVFAPDCWDSPKFSFSNIEVFHFDLASEKVTRLSRGGTVTSLAGASEDDLFMMWNNQNGLPTIRRLSLKDTLDFASKNPEKPPRTAASWTKLIDDVLKGCEVSAEVKGDALTPEALSCMADELARLFRERFEAKPPTDASGWDRLQRELIALDLPSEARPRFALVMGAGWGEYLRRSHRAVWRLGPGSLTQPVPPFGEQENPFAVMANPFGTGGNNDILMTGGMGWLFVALLEAEGRTILLTNEGAAGLAGVEAQSDPDWQRARELFAKEKAEEGQRLILDLVDRAKEKKNRYLVAQAGYLLYENKRLKGLEQLMTGQIMTLPPDARLYNLLGLAVLDADPASAATHFRDALRCDLGFESALLNLALAFEKSGERESALQCLRRYLRALPNRSNAADVRQRIAVLLENPQ